jgi:hypothetical protein
LNILPERTQYSRGRVRDTTTRALKAILSEICPNTSLDAQNQFARRHFWGKQIVKGSRAAMRS